MRPAALVFRRQDIYLLPAERHIPASHQVRSLHGQFITRSQRDVAVHRADGAALLRHVLRGIRHLQLLIPPGESEAAGTGQTRFFLLMLMAFLALLICGSDGQVMASRQTHVIIARYAASLNQQIVVRLHRYAGAAER